MIRYLKIMLVDGSRHILRVTRESPRFIVGIEVDAEGDEIVPRGVDPQGRPWHQRERQVQRETIKKTVEMRMNPTYATLEVVPQSARKKTAAQLDADIAEAIGKKETHATIAKHWEKHYAKIADLAVGDVILLGSVPPYTAHEIMQIEPAPRRRIRLHLERLPDRQHQSQSVLRPTDTVGVPEGAGR